MSLLLAIWLRVIGLRIRTSGTIWIPQVRCFAIPTHLMAIMLATQALGNKDKLSSFLIEGRGFSLPICYFPICPRALFVLQ